MSKVQGVKEKLHSPLYDAFFVKEEIKDATNRKKFTDFMTDPRVIRFFVDIQSKTKLETNLQASGVLPSLNTFEARALRVVVSNLRPQSLKVVRGGCSEKRAQRKCDLGRPDLQLGDLVDRRGKDHDRDAHLLVSIRRWCKSGPHRLQPRRT